MSDDIVYYGARFDTPPTCITCGGRLAPRFTRDRDGEGFWITVLDIGTSRCVDCGSIYSSEAFTVVLER